MSLSNPKTAISEQDLKDFYDKIKPFLAPKTYAGFTPIGTVIQMIAESAPANYLICDGATYNVVDYPELCAHLWSLPTNSQYKVSGDATKFKVPDLRGEFLRGTGANSHGNGGNGTTVGVHQDSTTICNTAINNSTAKTVYFRTPDKTTNVRMTTNEDKANLPTVFTNVADTQVTVASYIDRSSSTTQPASYSVRPTNTSVLFCIATKNIYLDPKNDYSTEEKVIGTWITGETLYQRTVVLDSGLSFADKNVTKSFNILDATNLSVKKMEGTYYFTYGNTNKKYVFNLGQAYMEDNDTSVYLNSWLQDAEESDKYVKVSIKQSMSALGSAHTLHNIIVTIQYTKTT